MENPIKIHDLGVPLFLETPKYLQKKTEMLSFVTSHNSLSGWTEWMELGLGWKQTNTPEKLSTLPEDGMLLIQLLHRFSKRNLRRGSHESWYRNSAPCEVASKDHLHKNLN